MTTDAARILVVEDNADTSALLRDLLEAEGYDVASVATGEAAFEALAVTPDIDLVVLDLMLPGMSGYEVIERMRALPELADLPVLVLSALSSPSARVRGLRDGAHRSGCPSTRTPRRFPSGRAWPPVPSPPASRC